MLFVFLGTVNHEFVDVEDSASVYKKCVKPAMESRLFAVVKLYAHVIVDQ